MTPKVPTTQGPTSISAIVPATPPTATNVTTRNGSAACVTRSVRRRPTRSATGPSTSVPMAPQTSISASVRPPSAFVPPVETIHSGTNVRSPNHATLRSPITTESSVIAPTSSSPLSSLRCVVAGATCSSDGSARRITTAIARTGTIASVPPPSPSHRTSGVTTIGPSA